MSQSQEVKPYPIVKICASVWQANAKNCRTDCSGYVKQVAAELKVLLPDTQANGIIDFLTGNEAWLRLHNDAKHASELASQGYFIVAGLKEAGHGHVAVVVPGWSEQGFPMGYWGSLRGVEFAGANESLTKSWTRPDLALVSYFGVAVPALTA